MMNPLCLRATLMLVCMTVGLFGIRSVTGSNLSMGLVNLADYADTATGIYPMPRASVSSCGWT